VVRVGNGYWGTNIGMIKLEGVTRRGYLSPVENQEGNVRKTKFCGSGVSIQGSLITYSKRREGVCDLGGGQTAG